MAQYFEPSTDTDANFANSVSGQANSYFLPAIYSKKVLNFFRKASVLKLLLTPTMPVRFLLMETQLTLSKSLSFLYMTIQEDRIQHKLN